MTIDIEVKDPRQFLFGCFAAMRGGHAVQFDLIVRDYAEWVEEWGVPTKEKVLEWVARKGVELEFALNVIAGRDS